mgnify:CR=1 FL=1
MAKRRRGTKQRRQSGLLPGEARRRSLVTVQRPVKVGEEGKYGDRELFETDNYIVTTRRLDGVWAHFVEYGGQTWRLPGKAVDAMLRHRASIVAEQRRARAQETHARLASLALKDQAEAAIAKAEGA